MPPTDRRELRLAFAMGGGVSLGAFSGAALAEVLKLALLRGRDARGRPYERVVVDVFSGASAGAMALAVMLRTLVHSDDAARHLARERLLAQFPGEFPTGDDRRDALVIDAQVVQDVQERIWGREITLQRLLGRARERRSLRHAGGILDRRAVDEIARDTMLLPSGAVLGGRSALLADRVLFASTLTNVTPVLCDARRDLDADDAGLLALSDGLTSKAHRELRVFDFSFVEVDPTQADRRSDVFPDRWRRYHHGAEHEGVIGDLRAAKTWARVAATAVAAGAFPFAFEPVVLMRDRWELGDDLWPAELRDAGIEKYPFTYIDGGVLNNEPIREAFRLSAFIDGRDPLDQFDRRLIFVDPAVAQPGTRFRVDSHREHELRGPGMLGSLDGFDLVRRPTLDRLVPQLATIATIVLNEARSVEGDRVFVTRRRFELRDRIRAMIDPAVGARPASELLDTLRTFCSAALARERATAQVPAGQLTLEAELERVIAEEIQDRVTAFEPLRGTAREFLAHPAPHTLPHAAQWLRAFLYVALDYVLDLEGKQRNSRLIAIAPVLNIRALASAVHEHARDGGLTTRGNLPAPEVRPLPGGMVFGFGGFCSAVPGRYERELARHCTREFLEVCGLITPDAAGVSAPTPEFTSADARAYRTELRQGLELLGERLREMVQTTTLIEIFPGLDGAVLRVVAGEVERAVRRLGDDRPAHTRFELRIHVPDRRFELDGAGVGDRDLGAQQLADGRWCIITELEVDGAGRWRGPFLDGSVRRLAIDRAGALPGLDQRFCTIALPESRLVRAAALQPNPMFETVVRLVDEGQDLEGEGTWSVAPGVTPLERWIAGTAPEVATGGPVGRSIAELEAGERQGTA